MFSLASDQHPPGSRSPFTSRLRTNQSIAPARKAYAPIGLLELPTAFNGPLIGHHAVFMDDEFRIQIARGAAVGWDDLDAVANLNRRIFRHRNLHMLFGAVTYHLTAEQVLYARSAPFRSDSLPIRPGFGRLITVARMLIACLNSGRISPYNQSIAA